MSEDARVPWRTVFGNDRGVEVEIGPGNGDVLLAFAAAAPEVNFFGIERILGTAEAVLGRAARRGLDNVRVVAGDARCIVARLVPDASVDAYHIYFPDPWPKTGHRHRRLANAAFAAALMRTLAPDGRVEVATDVPAVLDAFVMHFERAGLRRDSASPPRARPRTIFERKYGAGGTHHGRFVRGR
jgi:tRNA (guanine-N7-)-methyltransferase